MPHDAAPGRPASLVCFGEVLIDLLAQPPVEGQARAFEQYAGGAPANVAVAAARLGADSQFVGMLGQDMFGDFLHEALAGFGVGVGHTVRTAQAKTALAFVALDEAGERSFSFYRPPAADLLFRAEHFDADCLARADVFHFCSNSLTDTDCAQATFTGAQRAGQAGAVVSFDLNLRPALWPEGVDPTPTLWQGLALAQVVKLSREELQFLAGHDAQAEAGVVARLLAGRTELLVITDGPGAVVWTTRQAQGQVSGFAVQVRDTTAAGDAFVGGLLVRLVELGGAGAGFTAFCADPARVEEAVRFGTATGALAVTRKGAFAAMPTRAEVLSLL
ncbi:carbohydrate kinase [Pseudoxanthomonas winnipegensis]|jgi:fructokinase|uniref:Carbohydrate kinase n=1 Tax=Pseudoxanthomonas winnipegensis TaxID=2480810 RepID=A0ABY1WFI6_9GAMM|nr:carbohydrate kinase [Pseudoxanthomonas winnipegensis]TAA08998.1 carbohydrate kinase [Pseudoxanthomonas winnipegensis]TAA20698.1 carbohydrate kinase [Pseudoxanthomonas winnipegensis]TAH71649.1 carbohydrate kinase [Pseudoxanthomonas winnipegensis]